MWNALEARGLDLKNIFKDTSDTNLTGIARNIATASEESISGLAAMTNTNNFYVAQILGEVRLIRENKNIGDTPMSAAIDYSPMFERNYQMQVSVDQHLAETLAECKKIASQGERATKAAERTADLLGRVTSYKGNRYGINIQ